MTGIMKIKPVLRAVLGSAIVAAALLLPAQAMAQSNDCSQVRSDPSAAQYCPQSDVLAANSGSSNGPTSPAPAVTEAAVTADTGSSLPFTGLDVGVLVAAAAILLGTGLALRRFTVSPSAKE